MALTLTTNAERESEKVNLKPQIVLKIDGVDSVFGAVEVLKYIQFDDTGLLFDDGWSFDGLNVHPDGDDIISLDGTTTTINQQLYPDKGSVSSVSSVEIALLDIENAITRLISPGVEITDMLGRKAKLYMGFDDTAYPDDFVVIFSGIIDDIRAGAGKILLNVAHPDQKKRQELFQKVEITLDGALDAVTTSVAYDLVDSTRGLYQQGINLNDLSTDTSFRTFIKVDDEIMEYTAFPTSPLTVTRGALGTTAASHDDGAKGEAFVVLEGDLVELALKLMLSTSGVKYYFLDQQATSFNWVTADENVQNAIYFDGVDLASDYGVTVGDYVLSTGAANAANSWAAPLRTITQVESTDTGSYIVVNGANLVDELESSALISIASKYSTWPVGLAMTPDQVDIEEHEYWQDLLLSTFDYRFYIKDQINAKDFIEKELYAPYGAYSIPRKGKASMGFHIGPVPRGEIPILNKHNIKRPDNLIIRRTINRNMYNTVVYKADEDALEDKFLSGFVHINSDSTARIPVGTKALTFESKGIRTDLLASQQTAQAARRILGRYKFGAEHIEQIEVFYKVGFAVEPGDLVLLDPEDLQLVNTQAGDRDKPAKFFEVVNKSLNIKTGAVTLALVDTNYDSSERYGVISPSSKIASGTTTYAIIEDSYGEVFPDDEPRKWERYAGLPVLIHDKNFTFSEEVVFTGFAADNRYKMLFETALSQPVQAGWIIDIPTYPTGTNLDTNRLYKLYHAHFSPQVEVTAGVSATVFTVGAGDIGKFKVGLPVRVHSADFTSDSGEVIVESIAGNNVTVKTTMGYTPSAGHLVDFIGFADGDQPYRLL